MRRPRQADRRATGVDRRVGGRRAVRLMALVALLALAAVALPAAGSAASSTAPGELYAFGDNFHGQLGSTTNFETHEANFTPEPVTLPGESGPVTQAASGCLYSLVVTASGQLYGFGANFYGELGNPDNLGIFGAQPTPTPVTLPGESGPVTQTAGSCDHSLAVTASGQLYAFGENEFGQLGDATHNHTEYPNTTPAPVTLPGQSGPVIQAAAGWRFSLALTASGQLYSFGENKWGQLGTPANAGHPLPNPTPTVVTLPGATGPVTQIAAGSSHSLAVTASGQLYAFGDNEKGQLGNATNMPYPSTNPAPMLVTLPGEVGPVVQAAAGDLFSLALTASGQLYVFGEDCCGQLGILPGQERARPTPRQVGLPDASGSIARIAAGSGYSLALTSTGELYAFGDDAAGQLAVPPGERYGTPHPTPMRVSLPGGASVETVATGCCTTHTLAVIADLAVSPSTLPAAEAGVVYSAQAQADGGAPPYRWSATGLPAGLAIDPATGAIAGTPIARGKYTPTIAVTDSDGIEASASPTLTVDGPPPAPPDEVAPLPAPVAANRAQASSAPAPGAQIGADGRDGSPPSEADSHGGAPPRAAGGDARSPSPQAPAPAVTSSWTVHKYVGQITKAGSRALGKPFGLAFDGAGDLFVTDIAEKGFVDRYGSSGELECQLGSGFPEGDLTSVTVNDETGDVYVGESGDEETWLYKPQGGCAYKPPVRGEAHGPLYLAADNAPGPRHGDVYVMEVHVFSGAWQAWDVKTNAEGELEPSETGATELPEPPAGFQSGSEVAPAGIAVDPTSGTVYIPSSQYFNVVNIYNGEDALQARTLSTGDLFEPVAVAVDPTDGEVYVLDVERDVVDEFDSAGEWIGEITGAHTPAGRFIEPRDVAVKPATHEVFVSDAGAHAIDVFGADEHEPLVVTPTTEAASAVGTAGATLNGSLEHSAGEPLSWLFHYAPGSSCHGGSETERKPLTEGETGLLHEHATIAELEPATEYTVCLSDESTEGVPGGESAASFETAGLAPTGSAVTVKSVTPFDAVFEGSVNPQNEVTGYRFEYATNPNFEGATVAGAANFAKGTYPTQPVGPTDLAAALAPNTTYYVRLVAEDATGRYTSPATSFTTGSASASGVSFWNAREGETVAQERFEGYVNPGYERTTCAFQYTAEAQYAQRGFNGAASVPCAPSPFGGGTVGFSEAVSATASGLQAGVTYCYRLIATNASGASEGPLVPATATFATWGPPSPTTESAAGLAPHSATLSGAVNPDHLATSYHFEYASEAAYARATEEGRSDPYVDGLSTPAGQTGAGADREPLPAASIAGLAADTTYHYRLVVANEAGARYGQDETFATEHEPVATTGETTATTPTITPSAQPTSSPPLVTSPRKPAKPARATLTNAQKLAKALKACRKDHNKHRRSTCEKQAHKRYRPKRSRSRSASRVPPLESLKSG